MAIKDGWRQIQNIFAEKGVHLSPLESRVLDALLGCERVVPKEDIIDHMYGHREDGGPESAENVMYIMIGKLRNLLPVPGIPWKLTPHSSRGYQLTYDDNHQLDPNP